MRRVLSNGHYDILATQLARLCLISGSKWRLSFPSLVHTSINHDALCTKWLDSLPTICFNILSKFSTFGYAGGRMWAVSCNVLANLR